MISLCLLFSGLASFLHAQAAVDRVVSQHDQCLLSLARAERNVERLQIAMKGLEEYVSLRPDDDPAAGLAQSLSMKNVKIFSNNSSIWYINT